VHSLNLDTGPVYQRKNIPRATYVEYPLTAFNPNMKQMTVCLFIKFYYLYTVNSVILVVDDYFALTREFYFCKR